MLLIFGSTIHETLVNVVAFVCGYCHVHAPQNVVKRSNRFTLFFIPLFSFSTSYVNQCTNCGAETRITSEQAHNSLTWSAAQR
ncbi:zinc-ribbon domain-containing protein [Leifsonia sp. 2MCAF36]|uniref:zinc-ribbon domain-containing protein n=1 Tax=Leifsonia sp. 2MCAF36 TaxID=3232988 RepID=UPI003F967413